MPEAGAALAAVVADTRDWRAKYDIVILTNNHGTSIIRVFLPDKSERLLWLPNAIMREGLARFPTGLVEGREP
jgi:hypothetical protein